LKILITGGTGFVGSRVSSRLAAKGHSVTAVGRSAQTGGRLPDGAAYIQGDTTVKGSWLETVSRQDAVINLAGSSIFTRWTHRKKEIIRQSRILTTRNVVSALRPAASLVSASAVGYYGFRGEEKLAENAPAGGDFLAGVCVDWEREAMEAAGNGVRVAIVRFGIVLGRNGGAMSRMVPLYRWFAGGPLGSGSQWFSWIHMEDLVSAILFLIDDPSLSGPFNLCSPNPVRNRELSRSLGKALGRPSFLKTPGFLLRAVLGEFGSVLLEGQRATPKNLLDSGFQFEYPRIDNALSSLISS